MQNSKIEWTTHTFNPWHGCVKVSPGCQHCYAETLDKRFGRAVWGPAKTTPRMGMSENYWRQPARWNEAALRQPYPAERPRVFVASMADVFEDHPGVVTWRARLWETIGACDAMDWLLLTKRPENIMRMVPQAWALGYWPDHVWIGTSVEDQRRADERIPHLLRVPARVRFLSCEPLLAPLNLSEWFPSWVPDDERIYKVRRDIHWVICGGESGPGARPMHQRWARSLRNQCVAAGVPFFFKQHGEWIGGGDWEYDTMRSMETRSLWAGAPNDPDDLPILHYRVGKHASGRLLDGREWNELPV